MSLKTAFVAVAFVVARIVVGQSTTSAAIDPQTTALKVTVPSSQDWWVQGQTNLLAWTCRSVPTLGSLTVYVQNSDVNVLTAATPIIANIDNTVCSKTVDATQFKVATGYQILLTNPVNISDVYAISDSFEIKASGSPFPSITTTDLGGTSTSTSSTGTATGAGSSPSQSSSGVLSKRIGAPVGILAILTLSLATIL